MPATYARGDRPASTCIVRDTAAQQGPHACRDARARRASRHLRYGRIILDAGDAPLRFDDRRPRDRAGLPQRRGDGDRVDGAEPHARPLRRALCAARRRDRGARRAPTAAISPRLPRRSARRHPVQVVRFADVQQDPGAALRSRRPVGQARSERAHRQERAGRAASWPASPSASPGNWTSWPPHEHAAMLEEAYLYIDMPAPAFGVQLVYTDAREPELATIVREGDVVLMPQGYHPNVAAPGGADQLPLDDGRQSRGRRPPVRRRERAARLRSHGLRPRQGPVGEEMTSRDSVLAFQHRDWTAIPVEHIADGIERQMIWGDRLMICRLRFAPQRRHRRALASARADDDRRARTRRASSIDGQERIASARRRARTSRRTSSTARRCSTKRSCSSTSSRRSAKTSCRPRHADRIARCRSICFGSTARWRW